MSNFSIYTTTAVVLIDSDGNRLLAKYYDPPHLRKQRLVQLGCNGFSSRLRTLKDQRTFGDILIIQDHLVLYRSIIDMTIYVCLKNLDLVRLCLDEMVDDGIFLETDALAIASRVSRPKADVGGVNLADMTINEQTIMQAFSTLRDKAAQKILQGSL
ncbi:hypothetical protein DFH28DRAFT_1078419 [Melampsora americana]|nr:hypothetical protein DFH28DRAFT_1078419 [Melampsora americana]